VAIANALQLEATRHRGLFVLGVINKANNAPEQTYQISTEIFSPDKKP